MIGDRALFLAKAEVSLRGAESEFANRRYDNAANRAYYACFQAAISALIEVGVVASGRDQWGHAFVQGQFALQLITRRKIYPARLRDTLARNFDLRRQADYDPVSVLQVQASRAIPRARIFLEAVSKQGSGAR